MRALNDRLQDHPKKTEVIKMRKIDGSLASSNEENAECFSVHFNKIFNNQHILCNPSVLDLIKEREQKEIVGDMTTIDEIINAVKWIQPRKSPGPTGLTSDTIRALLLPNPGLDPDAAQLDRENIGFRLDVVHTSISNFWTGAISIK